jgi:hypothetical protein
MKDSGKWAVAIAAGFGLLLAAPLPAVSKPAFSKAANKPCNFCHVGTPSKKVFTDAGKYYREHQSLAGFAEDGKPPKPPAKVTAETAAAPAGKEEARPREQMAGKECPCDCGCPCCKEKRCPHCGHAHGKRKMPPMMEKMKGHLEEMRKAVSDLRENENAVEGAADIEALRKSVLLHLKKLDDLQEAHLRHMESMMDARHGGKPGPPHMHSQ